MTGEKNGGFWWKIGRGVRLLSATVALVMGNQSGKQKAGKATPGRVRNAPVLDQSLAGQGLCPESDRAPPVNETPRSETLRSDRAG